jgi:hypothetical protein
MNVLELLIGFNIFALILFCAMSFILIFKKDKFVNTISDKIDNKITLKIEELEGSRLELESKLDDYVDLINVTKDSLNKNLESFTSMLEELERKEGYFDVDVVRQVIKANGMLRARLISIYEDFVKKVTDNKYER